MPYFLVIIFIPLFCLYCWDRSKQKKVALLAVIAIMIFCTPFFGYFIVESLSNHKKPCNWCGNKDNEAVFCGLCGKNEEGIIRPNFNNHSKT